MKRTLELNSDNFTPEVLNATIPVLVDFYTTTCGPCKQMAPVLEEIAATLGESAKITKVDCSAHPELAAAYNIVSVPTMILFRQGIEQERLVGTRPKSILISKLQQAA
jgi:thioredoxin 1